MKNRLEKINFLEIESKIIQKTKEEVIDLNLAQLEKGLNSRGDDLPEYQEDYFKLKKSLGLATAGQKMNFTFEGNFNSGFFMDSDGDIGSKDEKTPKLEKLAGYAVFGLTDESMDEYRNDPFLELYIDELRKQLGL